MIRTISGFHQDEDGDWVAEVSCLHSQHVRHRPPFQDRSWTQTEETRRQRLGTPIECPRCDRAELPEGLVHTRCAGPFDNQTLPAGLREVHRVASGTWGLLQVHRGIVGLSVPETAAPIWLSEGQSQAIPPDVPHRLSLEGPMELSVEFLARPGYR